MVYRRLKLNKMGERKMKKLIISIVILSLVMLFVGCATFAQNRRETYVTTHPEMLCNNYD